jgi:hypothetical protein
VDSNELGVFVMSKRQASVTFVVVMSLLLSLTVAATVSAQYYTPPPTQSPSSTPTPFPTATSSGTHLVLYEGPLTTAATSTTLYGFGNTADNITSPGPTLDLQDGVTYTMTVYNIDPSMAHSWEIVPTKEVSNSPLFGAGIEIINFIPAGSSASVTFTVNQTGNFYYVCTRPGHIGLGMWGDVVVSSAVPELTSPITIVLITLALTAVSAALVHQRSKRFGNFSAMP